MSSIAAVVMLTGTLILGGDADDLDDDDNDNLSVRAVVLDTGTDAVAAAGMALTGGIILAASGFTAGPCHRSVHLRLSSSTAQSLYCVRS